MVSTVYTLSAPLGDGTERPLSHYRGKVLLIVNTASECGFTPQYAGLEALHQKYAGRGLAVLAFPSNDFGAQEPGTDAQIRQFCSTRFRVTFDLFAKSHVKGAAITPLFKFLTEATPPAGPVTWNFNKFLVDRGGRPTARFDSRVDPLAPELAAQVEALLGE